MCKMQPPSVGLNGMRSLTIFHLHDGMVVTSIDDTLLGDDGMGAILDQCPADSPTRPCVDKSILWTGIESIFAIDKLWMKNDIHGTWCRTTPLWGRGLSKQNTGRSDRLHDCRARNVIEAIMWHGFSKKSDAYPSFEKFSKLSKEDRDAVVKFIESI